jgi:hypothetical protein
VPFAQAASRRHRAATYPVPKTLALPYQETASTQQAFGQIMNELAGANQRTRAARHVPMRSGQAVPPDEFRPRIGLDQPNGEPCNLHVAPDAHIEMSICRFDIFYTHRFAISSGIDVFDGQCDTTRNDQPSSRPRAVLAQGRRESGQRP